MSMPAYEVISPRYAASEMSWPKEALITGQVGGQNPLAVAAAQAILSEMYGEHRQTVVAFNQEMTKTSINELAKGLIPHYAANLAENQTAAIVPDARTLGADVRTV